MKYKIEHNSKGYYAFRDNPNADDVEYYNHSGEWQTTINDKIYFSSYLSLKNCMLCSGDWREENK